jgi:hypothetical protein
MREILRRPTSYSDLYAFPKTRNPPIRPLAELNSSSLESRVQSTQVTENRHYTIFDGIKILAW